MGFQDSNRLYQLSNLNLFLEFVEATLEHPVPCRLLAAADAASVW